MDWLDLHVSDDILCEIGRITVYKTHIEKQIANFIRYILKLDEDEAILLMYRLSIWRLLDILESLLYKKLDSHNEQLDRFRNFQKEVKGIVTERNDFVHSMWGFGETLKANSATRIEHSKDSKSGKIRRTAKSVSLAHLRDVGEKLKHLSWLIGDIRVKVCPLENIS